MPATVGPSTAARAKLLPKFSMAIADLVPDLPPTASNAPGKLPDPATLLTSQSGSRRQDTAAAKPSSGAALPPSLPIDVNVPIPIPPKLTLPIIAGGTALEPMPAPVSDTAEPAKISLEPAPVLEVKINLNQPVPLVSPDVPLSQTGHVPGQKQTTVKAPVAMPAAAAQPVDSEALESPARGPTPQIPNRSSGAFTSATNGSTAIQPAAASGPDTEESDSQQQNPGRGAPDPAIASRPADSLASALDPAPDTDVRRASHNAPNQAAPDGQPRSAEPILSGVPPPYSANPPAAGAAQIPPVTAAPPATAGATKPEPQPAGAPQRAEPILDQPRTQQPLRSMALEFTPDGAADIKVRLSERGGNVHISLHGTDPSLAGRVREGVSDLVGSLSKAGYDAEAWTPGQGRQNQRQQPEPRQPTGKGSGGADTEEFSGMLQQPIQEIS
jgi:hypothetical protein